MTRMGRVIGVKGEALAEYRRLHDETWPQIRALITACNITNYSIFLKEPENLLFAYWEYVGDDFDADMARMGESEAMRRWWALTDPMQEPLPTRREGEWWAEMTPVFFNP